MYNNNVTMNKVEEVRPPNILDELAYAAIDKVDGDIDKVMDDFYSMALLFPSKRKPMTDEE